MALDYVKCNGYDMICVIDSDLFARYHDWAYLYATFHKDIDPFNSHVYANFPRILRETLNDK